MAAEPQDREIDGITFTVRPLLATRSLKLLARLNRALGPSLAVLAAAQGKVESDSLAEALKLLGEKLTDSELDGIVKEALDGATFAMTGPDGQPMIGVLAGKLETLLQGRPETLLKLLAFALEVNYKGFFPGLKGLAAQALQKASRSVASVTLPKLG